MKIEVVWWHVIIQGVEVMDFVPCVYHYPNQIIELLTLEGQFNPKRVDAIF
jgi:hypothetical protein